MVESEIAQNDIKEDLIMFHITPVDNLDSILEHGLIPSIGPRSEIINEATPSIYLFTTIDDLMNAHWLEDYFGDDDLTVIEVDTTDIEITGSFGDDSWEHTVDTVITPDRLRVLDNVIV